MEVPQSLDEGIPFTAPPAASHGYYLLAYHLLNLTVACKPCNSGLKKSYFPIGGTYDLHGDDPRQMGGEQPWLMYPIGDLDVDPEDGINFYGILPRSTSQRGLVTIIFFGLDNAIGRKQLMRDRARLIVCLYPQLQMAQHSSVEAAAFVAKTCAESEPHTNCARSFVRLFQCDQAAAGRVADEATSILFPDRCSLTRRSDHTAVSRYDNRGPRQFGSAYLNLNGAPTRRRAARRSPAVIGTAAGPPPPRRFRCRCRAAAEAAGIRPPPAVVHRPAPAPAPA